MPLIISRSRFRALIHRLAEDGHGRRESGAFLLAPRATRAHPRVTAIAYYSDLDPHSLTGGIDFHADGYTKLAKICDEQELIVVADIHTHPLTAGQSRIDRQHPMIAIRGHIALISPNYAQGRVGLEDLSAYLYQGNGDWEHARTVELIRHPRIRDLVSVTAKKRAP